MFLAVFLILIQPGHAKSNCKPGEHWVRAHSQSAYVRSDGTPVAGSFHKAHCKSNPVAYAVWIGRLKDGVPQKWEFKNEKAKIWTEADKERVLEALSSLPDGLRLDSVEGIYRMKTFLEHPANPAANHEHHIVLYDEAFRANQNLARVIAHEFAHNLYRQLYGGEGAKSYAQAADWIPVPLPGSDKRVLMAKPGREFVAKDGEDGPSEDFSNNIEFYLFNPKELKAKTPKVYNWISKRYGDKFKIGKGR